MRQIQHKARLNEEPVRLSPDALVSTREAILQLWKTVFASGDMVTNKFST